MSTFLGGARAPHAMPRPASLQNSPFFRPGWAWALPALSLVLNLLFIASDLPEVDHPDEPRVILHAVAMGTGDFNPHFFFYPTLWLYIVFAAQAITAAGGLAFGWIRGKDHLAALVFTDPTMYFLVGRLLTAALGAASVLLAWRIGRRFGAVCGWCTALSLALCGPFIWQSHFATPDVPLTFGMLLSLDACLGALAGPRTGTRWLWWPAISAGLATSMKYNGFVAFGAVGALVLLRSRGQPAPRFRRLPLAAGLAAGAFLLTSPYTLLAFTEFLRDARVVAGGIPLVEGVEPGPFGYGLLVLRAQGPLLLVFAFLGWWRLLAGRSGPALREAALVLAGCFAAYLVLIHASSYRTPRTLLPLIPALGLGTGIVLGRVTGAVRRRFASRSWTLGAACTGWILVFLPAVPAVIEVESDLAHPSASIVAGRWFRGHIPAGSPVFVDSESKVKLLPDRNTVLDRLDAWEKNGSAKCRQLARAYRHYLDTDAPNRGYRLVPTRNVTLNTFASGPDGANDYREDRLEGIRYVIAPAGPLHPGGDPATARFYSRVNREFRVIHAVTDDHDRSVVILQRRGSLSPSLEGTLASVP